MLDQGRIVAEGTPAELKNRIPGGHVQLHFADPHEFRSAAELLPAAGPDQDRLVLRVPADGPVDSLRELLDELTAPVSGSNGCRSTLPTLTTCSSP